MADERPKDDQVHRVTLTPATETDAGMPTSAGKSVRTQPALEHDTAGTPTAVDGPPLHLVWDVGGTVANVSGTIVGPSEPQAETPVEQIGVLGYVGGIALGGYSVGRVPGAVIGGAVAIATVRYPPIREAAFKFIRGKRKTPPSG